MKNIRVTLCEFEKSYEPDNMLDIDWPKVQKQIGEDHLEWIYKQAEEDCQLMLEFSPKGQKSLVVEFYNNQLAKTYALMWSQ